MRDGYQIISELVAGNPNVDMLITKPYLYVYVEKDKIDDVKKNGISTGEGNTISAFFIRLPESKYPEYLETHSPVKISVSKLNKIKDQEVEIKPVNFKHSKDILEEDDIEDILVKHMKTILHMFKTRDDISELPRADVIFSKGVVPAFAIKVLDSHLNLTELGLAKRIGAKVARATTSKQGRSLARQARRSPGAYKSFAKNIAGVDVKGPMTRGQGSKIIRVLKSASG